MKRRCPLTIQLAGHGEPVSGETLPHGLYPLVLAFSTREPVARFRLSHSIPETFGLLSVKSHSLSDTFSRPLSSRGRCAGRELQTFQMAGSSQYGSGCACWKSSVAFPVLTERSAATLEPRKGGRLTGVGVDVQNVAHAYRWATTQHPQNCRRWASRLQPSTLVRQSPWDVPRVSLASLGLVVSSLFLRRPEAKPEA